MAERRSHDRIKVRYGKCLGENCDRRKNGEIIEIPARKEFVCPDCGKPLRECPPTKKNNKTLYFIIGGIFIALIVAAIIIFAPGKEEHDQTEITDNSLPIDSLGNEVLSSNGVESNQITTDSIESSMDSISTKEEPGVEEIPDEDVVSKEPKKESAQSSISMNQSSRSNNTISSTSSHKLSYGTWTGEWKNGQPHGTGTMTYSSSHTIDSRDTKARVAQPGEYIVGEWDNGHLVQGRWFKKDGTKEAVIIGKAG